MTRTGWDMVYAVLATGAGFWAMLVRGDMSAAIGFFAWGCALYNQSELKRLRKEVGRDE